MLLELTVRDLALIKEAEVEFDKGLNILTGETGAGKSIIIGSVALALGAKAKADIIRKGSESAYIELVFSVEDENKRKKLEEEGVSTDEEGIVIISRKISPGKSLIKINGETVTLSKLRDIASNLMDIYGQHEHQTLLNPRKHLEILDDYIKDEIAELKERLGDEYRKWRSLKKKLAEFDMDADKLMREKDFLRFEIEEIENAAVREGEEEELAERYRRFSHLREIAESVGRAHGILSELELSSAVAEIERACEYTDELRAVRDQLFDADSIISDVTRELSSYESGLEFDDEEFAAVEERLDLIRNIFAKYGEGTERLERALSEKKERLSELEDYDENKRKYEKELSERFDRLIRLCAELTKKRRSGAKRLSERIGAHLKDLGFSSVYIELEFSEKELPDENGRDSVRFIVALNPGENPKPLTEVASGGELSRVMLAIKTVLADTDDIPTIIFDEIDTGISGRTAQKVSEKLSVISERHQVICITHLPQIAAMADTHFVIKKTENDGRNVTEIRKLSEEESLNELSRLLGGAEITETVRKNAEEIKKLAKATKDRLYLR